MKQVDFDVKVFPLGNGSDGTMTRDLVSAFIRDNYLLKPNDDKSDKSYWAVFDISTNQISNGTIYYQVTLVKYAA